MSARKLIGRRVLTARDMSIITAVAECRLLQASQLERLFFYDLVPGMDTRQRQCRRVLHNLTQSGHLRRLTRRIGGVRAGSSAYVYGLGPLGARLALGSRPHRFLSHPSLYFLEHTLCQAELYTRLRVSEQRGNTELLEIQMEPRCWRTFYSLEHGLRPLKPDMFAWVQTATDRLSWFIEIDRGTAYMHALRQKLALYVQYYLSGDEQKERGVFPKVLWIAPSAVRAQFLMKAIQPTNDRVPGLCAVTIDNQALQLIIDLEPSTPGAELFNG